MPRHDYDLPPDWDALSDEEKSKWMTRERNRRQARRQQDANSMPNLSVLDEILDRIRRKIEARQNKEYE